MYLALLQSVTRSVPTLLMLSVVYTPQEFKKSSCSVVITSAQPTPSPSKLEIDEAYGDLLPDQKIEHVRKLLAVYGHVGMIGDGVNDAPAMTVATIGIAMGAAGTDTAIETADIALMKDDLNKVAEAVHLGRQTLRIIRTNIIFALAIKAVFLVLALFGYTSLWLAILADTGATLLVILNALRLLR
jgi:Zn2+/Cd2+-exporting ATPase